MSSVLSVSGLSAGYDRVDVFRDVELTLGAGETVRVAGRNAAGKSTLLRCLSGLHSPRTGYLRVCGFDLVGQGVEARRELGYSSGEAPFPYLTGREHLDITQRVYGLGAGAIVELLERFAGWSVVAGIDDEVRRYSHGMRQQLAALLAVAHNPGLLLLDEATDGFDDESLDGWLDYLAERARLGGALAFVEHRDEVARRFPAAGLLILTRPHVEV